MSGRQPVPLILSPSPPLTCSTTDPFQIKEIQHCLGPELDDGVPEDSAPDLIDVPDIIFAPWQPLTLNDACRALPSRPVVDKLLSAYFNARYLHIRELMVCPVLILTYKDSFHS